jgi:hypothetical protein
VQRRGPRPRAPRCSRSGTATAQPGVGCAPGRNGVGGMPTSSPASSRSRRPRRRGVAFVRRDGGDRARSRRRLHCGGFGTAAARSTNGSPGSRTTATHPGRGARALLEPPAR